MDDTVNAFVSTFTIEGADGGPLSGLSFAAKDLYDVAGHMTGCGNPDWARTHPAADTHAPPVAALLGAGATLIGKTHTDELAYSLMGVNDHFGTPVNSGDPRRVPGGSSSGSAAAVAAGLVDIGLGSDTGGSVRTPASFCGVWGIRPTHGRIAIDRTMPLAPSFDTAGWFTRDPATLAAVGPALGLEGGDGVERLLLPVDIWARAGSATVAAMADRMAEIEALVGSARPVLLADEGLVQWREAFRLYQGHEIWEVHGPWITETAPTFGVGIAARFQMASEITEDEFSWAAAERANIQARMAEVLTPGTALVMPTVPGPAPFRDEAQADLDDYRARALEMLCPAGHAGLPQISMPAGKVEGGPVGLSIVGAAGMDRGLLALAAEFGA